MIIAFVVGYFNSSHKRYLIGLNYLGSQLDRREMTRPSNELLHLQIMLCNKWPDLKFQVSAKPYRVDKEIFNRHSNEYKIV